MNFVEVMSAFRGSAPPFLDSNQIMLRKNEIRAARRSGTRREGRLESCALNLTLHVDGYGYANSSSSNLPLLKEWGSSILRSAG